MKIQSSAADSAVQVDGGQLSLTFLYTPWVDKHAGTNRINLLSAVRKISLKEGGHVLAKKYIDTLKWRKGKIKIVQLRIDAHLNQT